MRNFILFLFIFSVLNNSAFANYITTFKLINGAFKYSSDELSGNSSTLGSPSLGALKILDERQQIGINLDVFFSTTSQSVSLYGIGLIYKYSFLGQGGNSIYESSEMTLSTTSKWELYSLATFKRYTYFLGSNKSTETRFDQTGDFFNFDLGLGSSYDLGKQLRGIAELSTTLFSFASSDNRVKFKSILLSFGVQKEF